MLFKAKKVKKLFKNSDTIKFLALIFLVLVGFGLGANFGKLRNLVRIKGSYQLAGSENISAKELKNALTQKDFTFINVHTPYEGEIAGTDLFVNYDEMIANKAKLPQDKNAKIILYCKTGRMSEEALGTLKGMGYTNVRHLKGGMEDWEEEGGKILDLSKVPDEILPKSGFELPISWGDLGIKLVDLGVIDEQKFEKAVPLTDEQRAILTRGYDSPVRIDSSNGQFVVDMLWALGLAQKSIIYEEGPMGKEYKDKVGNFASTGGWTLAKGAAVNYLGRYELIPLNAEQQQKVAEIAKNVYRPCCGNPTWFPDCNHGMAALAAIELMVSKGISDEEIYRNILKLNSFWFPDTYLTTATYFARQGISWDKIDAKEVLGPQFSSAQGAMDIAKKVGPLPYGGGAGGSCGA